MDKIIDFTQKRLQADADRKARQFAEALLDAVNEPTDPYGAANENIDDGPDSAFKRVRGGQVQYLYSVAYIIAAATLSGGRKWTFELWATSWDDAEARLNRIKIAPIVGGPVVRNGVRQKRDRYGRPLFTYDIGYQMRAGDDPEHVEVEAYNDADLAERLLAIRTHAEIDGQVMVREDA